MYQSQFPVIATLALAFMSAEASAQQECGYSDGSEVEIDDLDYAECPDEQYHEDEATGGLVRERISKRTMELLTDGKGLTGTPPPDLTPVRTEAEDEITAVAAETARREREKPVTLPQLALACLLLLSAVWMLFATSRKRRARSGY